MNKAITTLLVVLYALIAIGPSARANWVEDGMAICTATGGQEYPQIISDGVGGAIVAWEDNRSGSWNIYAQRVSGSGAVQWTADGVAICTAARDQYSSQIISDGAGGAIVAWWDLRSGSSYDIYAQKVNASGSVQWTADGVTLCAATLDQCYPTIASDGWEGASITWYDNRNGNNDIYALRIDANGFAPLTDTDVPAVPIALHQNYPNPFNPATTIAYTIAEKGNVALRIYDASGKRVACLVDARLEKGSYKAEWNGKGENGNPAASGVYFCRLTAGDRTLSKKMVLSR